jgi:putative transposase
MPRTKRFFMNNSVHHVIVRGSQKQNVFLNDEDFLKFYHLLWKYKNRFLSKIYAYCFMSNHAHLLIDPGESQASLSKLMHGLAMSYALYFKYKYNKCGHIWQNRYKNFLVQKDDYLINAISYIEYNPVRANICSRAELYPWSSYRARVLGENNKLLDKFMP